MLAGVRLIVLLRVNLNVFVCVKLIVLECIRWIVLVRFYIACVEVDLVD